MPGATRYGMQTPEANAAFQADTSARLGNIEADVKEIKDGFRQELEKVKTSVHEEFNVVRERMHSHANTMNAMQLQWAGMKGFSAGQKAAFVMVGSLVGAAITAVVTWLMGKH
jgi:hypothetical protein